MDLIDDLESDLESDREEKSRDGDLGEDLEEGHKSELKSDELIAMAMKARASFTLASLRKNKEYIGHMNSIDRVLTGLSDDSTLAQSMGSEDSEEYRLVVASNGVMRDLDEEIYHTVSHIKELYRSRFPELEEIVTNDLDYARCAHRIGNETDMNEVKLTDILPSKTIMVISVTGSMTAGALLNAEHSEQLDRACQEFFALQADHDKLVQFLESRMTYLSPNLSALVGAQLASTLIALAGNLVALSQMPSCNIAAMGHDKRVLQGLSMASSTGHFGALHNAPVVQKAPKAWKKKTISVLSGKVALVARIDAYQNMPDGSQGSRLLKEIQAKVDKWQEPEKARTKKALPIPDEVKKKRRGGKRARKLKERLGQSELAAQRNRVSFAVGEDTEYGDSAMGMDMGMVGKGNGSKLRKVEVKGAMQLSKRARKALSASSSAAAVVDGSASSLVFTPVQGLELVNPNAAKERIAGANSAWFSSNAGFKSAAAPE